MHNLSISLPSPTTRYSTACVAALMVVMVWRFTLLPLPLKWDVRRWLTDRFLKRVKSQQ